MNSRFAALLERFQAGEADAAEMAELDQLLRADAGQRRLLVEAILLDVQLVKALGGIVPAEPAPVRRIPHVLPWAIAASVLLAASLSAFLYFQPDKPSSAHVESGQIVMPGAAPSRANIPHGERFQVGNDRPAVLRLSDTSHVNFDPATKAVIRGQVGDVRQVVELTEGGGTFHVVPGVNQFRVDTPLGSVTSLGTEFTVFVRASARKQAKTDDAKRNLVLAVSVADGSVRVDSGGSNHVIHAGKSRVFGDDGQQNNRDDGNQNNQNQGNQQSQK